MTWPWCGVDEFVYVYARVYVYVCARVSELYSKMGITGIPPLNVERNGNFWAWWVFLI